MICDNATTCTYIAAAKHFEKHTFNFTYRNALNNFGTTWTFIEKAILWYYGLGKVSRDIRNSFGRSIINIELLNI